MNLLETEVLKDVNVVGTSVLAAISQIGPVRLEPSGDERRLLRILLVKLTGRLLGRAGAGRNDPLGAGSVLPGTDQRWERGLVGVGGDDMNPRIRVTGVHLAHDAGRHGERTHRPQYVASVDPAGVEFGPHHFVEDDRTSGQQIRQPDRLLLGGRSGYRERSHCDTVLDGSRRHR